MLRHEALSQARSVHRIQINSARNQAQPTRSLPGVKAIHSLPAARRQTFQLRRTPPSINCELKAAVAIRRLAFNEFRTPVPRRLRQPTPLIAERIRSWMCAVRLLVQGECVPTRSNRYTSASG